MRENKRVSDLKLLEKCWEGGGNKEAGETESESDFITRDKTMITVWQDQLGHCWQVL